MKSTKEKVSYCIGLQTGMNLKQQFADMDMDCLNNGFHDGLANNDPKLAVEEIQSILNALRQQVEMQQRQFVAKMSEENKKKSEAFLLLNKEKEGVETLSSGLQYKVLQKSSGTGIHPTPLDVVKIHYRGSFIDGRVFDSSYQRGQPVLFPLNRVIAGWSEVLQLMQVGDKWEVYIPPYLAYGENGFGPEIGPNTALVFEIELLGINVSE
ncbi:MAG: FKBP-type peptidyl-prolyl cis-trans isomerase [Parachlamydiales bacterium]|nr:FKBP-type peptidyl-prolyl cis-trans isomerase [Verrucomicrobiota bacterium]MBX3719795.1 FKBP-type peptidyl-prolyl cis-trans isomerase [Candidatus Acheromyda pituitae]